MLVSSALCVKLIKIVTVWKTLAWTLVLAGHREKSMEIWNSANICCINCLSKWCEHVPKEHPRWPAKVRLDPTFSQPTVIRNLGMH